MPPYLPIVAINRSQNVRIGRGPGNAVPPSVNFSTATQGVHPQTGAYQVPFYADLGQPEVRRDLQRHSAAGAVISVGALTRTVSSDFYRASGLAPTATGAGENSVDVAAGVIRSRTYALDVTVAHTTGIAIADADGVKDRTDLVVVSNTGVLSVVQGTYAASGQSVAPAAPSNTMPVATVLVPAAAADSTDYTVTAAYPTS